MAITPYTMRYQLEFRTYQRCFRQPVRIGSSLMDSREGLIVRLISTEGTIGYGEVAPLESFGTESLPAAVRWLTAFHGSIDARTILDPDILSYPCVSFALAHAIRQCHKLSDPQTPTSPNFAPSPIPCSALIATPDDLTPEHLLKLHASGFRSIKVKVGSDPQHRSLIRDALDFCHHQLPLKFRIDANEQFPATSCNRWLDLLDKYPDNVDFLEQPMDRLLIQEMERIASDHPTRIALDESLGTLKSTLIRGGIPWLEDFLWVIKPALGDLLLAEAAGIPGNLRVFSSVFETAVGFDAILCDWKGPHPAGFGTLNAFTPGPLRLHSEGAHILPLASPRADFDQIWANLKPSEGCP